MAHPTLAGDHVRLLGLAAALVLGGQDAPRAQPAIGPGPGGGPSAPQSPMPGSGAAAHPGGGGLFSSSRSTLFGDVGGLRGTLDGYGISLGFEETFEVLGNVSGGLRRGADFDGLLQMSAGIDTQKAFGWPGGTFNISALQIHGGNLATADLDSLQTPSGIAARRSTRLWELWYQQAFLGGRVDVKLGQQSVDQEFVGSQYSGLFLNTTMGWPLVPSADLYAGGPAYPLSSLGARLRMALPASLTLLAGVFDDNPPGGPFRDDSQGRGAEQSGTRFSTTTGALFIGELQFALNQSGDGGNAGAGLPGTYKLGGWLDTASFPDQRLDTAGRSLADPSSSGKPAMRRGNFSIYGIADQMVWQPDPGGARSAGVFARVMGAPGDRNLIEFSLNAGVTLKAPLPGRDDDTFGIGFGIGQVSSTAGALDKEAALFRRPATQKRSSESFVEVTYQYQVAPWWQLQPDVQYVFLPGAGIADPGRPGRRIGNEAILGLRANVTF